MATTSSAALKESAQYWWLLLLQGIAAVIIGWFLLTNPISTTLLLVQFLGLYWLIAGIIDIVMSIVDKNAASRPLMLLSGLIGFIAGLVVLNNPISAGIVTPAMLMYFIAFAFLISGVLKIFLGNKQEGGTSAFERSWGSFFIGIFYVIMGALLLAMPMMASLATVVMSTALVAIVGGICMAVFSFKLRGARA